MSLGKQNTPPDSRTSYILRQLEGERLTIPGSKGVFRILASSKQTNGGIAVFTSGATLSDAPGFHWHQEAHDVFLVTKGFLKLWNGDKCRIMGPGDFAYVPPKVIHNPELLGPHTETLGLVAPGDWIDFFRYVSESYGGVLVPENDDRNLKALLIPKVMAAKDRFDVHFERDYTPPSVGDWLDTENDLPGSLQPYFLKSETGPRWLAGGVLSRPFITAVQTEGKFAISSIESSSAYPSTFLDGKRYLTFNDVDHCFFVIEGTLTVQLKGEEGVNTVTAGETLVVSAGQAFALSFASRFVKTFAFTNGPGLEALIYEASGRERFPGFVLPDELPAWDASQLEAAATKLGVKVE
ncbi:hypothetical protein SEUCBS139899_008068 [Sporothrix eucalyptigena]|uniref:Cupin type-2 domain-containing protein n=1 Tax=Sporothrix eucalyptigena TaxID=1812306 RepID=A0ABP0CCU9_9PEZI